MFPTGRPGIALLLLRIAVSLMLLNGALCGPASVTSLWADIALGAAVISLWLGFLTPVTAALCVLLEVLVGLAVRGAFEMIHLCPVLDATVLILLGPGGYSIDAKLFGRRQVILPVPDGAKDP
jgi:hypothetical protein